MNRLMDKALESIFINSCSCYVLLLLLLIFVVVTVLSYRSTCVNTFIV